MRLNKILQKDYTLSSLYYQIKLPLDVEILIPADDPVRLLSAFVEGMELSDLYQTYGKIKKNQATPRQLFKIMVYASMNRIYSSRDIETACRRDINFMYLLEGKFTASFMELSRHMRLPSLWAGMGRAMNNVSAALITNGSVALLATGNSLAAIVIALVLFVAVSVAMAVYTARMNAVMEPKEPPASQKSDEERREAFIAKYGLTEREWDVFSQMISSDSSAQEIADCLFLSKRTVERHISALYEKTGAKSRITMYLLYRND